MAEQTTSKKWVDYSDQDSEDQEHQEHHVESKPQTQDSKPAPKQEVVASVYKPTKEEVDHQLDRLDQLDERRIDEVWLLMESEDLVYLEEEMRYLKSKAKKGGNIVSVYPTRVADRFDVLAFIKIAYDYIQNGYDSSSRMKITVSNRNFERRGGDRNGDRNDRNGGQDRKKQGEYKEKNTADKQGEKKKYVDKQTGKEPESKKKMEEKIMENNERRYTKEEAEKKGSMIGGFRNKPSKKEEEVEVIPEPPAVKKESEEPKPKEEEKPAVVPAVVEIKEVKPKEAKKEKKEPKKDAKPKGGVKTIKSQNRFEGIEDLD